MKIQRAKIILLSSLLSMLLSVDSSAQTQQVTPEAFRAEINKAIAAYPHGMELYRESDNFERLIYAQVAKKLGLTGASSSSNNNAKNKALSLSNVSDLTPDVDDEDETSIAISRVNPNLIVAGANDIPAMNASSMPAYVSTDAGQNWETYRLPILNEAQVEALGDPIVICDDSGMFYYSFLISFQDTLQIGGGYVSDLMVARSKDGINWALGSPVLHDTIRTFLSEDKETIAVDRDPASPYYGRLYIVWTHFLNDAGTIAERWIAHSSDHGVTWSLPTTIPTAYGYFALLRVGKGGVVFIGSSHRDSVTEAGTFHAMMVSHDGGSTFKQTVISPYINYPSDPNYPYGGYPNELKDSVKAFPYVNFDVDPSNNNLFAVYGTYNSSYGCAEQYAVTSTNEGASWSAPKQIGTPDFLATDHFQPWVTFDPTSDKLRIIMYSSEEDLANNLLTRMVYFDFDNLTTPEALGTDLFDPNEVIGGTADPRSYPFIGDYTGADAYEGTFAVAWTEKNPEPNESDGDVFARVESTSGSVSMSKINESNLALQDPSPNPATGNSIMFVATSNVSSTAHLTLFDLNGHADFSTQLELTPGSETSLNLDIHALSAGVYRAVLESDGNMTEKNIVILH